MNFLRPEFEEAIAPFIEGDVLRIGRFSFTAPDVLRLAGVEAYTQAFNDWIWEEWIPTRRDRKDELLELNSNATRYEELKKIIASGRAIPFVGSGMSQPSGMPTWTIFLGMTCKQSKGIKANELTTLLADGQFEAAASAIFDGMPPRLFNERFEAAFSLTPGTEVKGPVRLLPYLFDSLAITTNFDSVLEHVYGGMGLSFQAVLHGTAIGDYRKKVALGSRSLLKLHGNYQEPYTRVLLKAEYDAFYEPGCKGRQELTLIFQGGGLVFLGCSLAQDRTMVLLKEIAASDPNMPRHFAFLQCPKTQAKTNEREHFLTERNIFPIWYDGDPSGDIEALLVGLMEDLKKL